MEIKEYSTPDGDYIVEIRCSYKHGDMARMFERNKDYQDVPLVILFNMGVDMPILTEEGQKGRVLGMLKMLRVGMQEVVQQIGGMVGAKLKGPPTPPTVGGRIVV